MELTTFWFILIAVLWIGYFFLEGSTSASACCCTRSGQPTTTVV